MDKINIKVLLILIIIPFLSNGQIQSSSFKDVFIITKIEKVNAWYVIYAKNSTAQFKIVSKTIKGKGNKKIKCNKKYELVLSKYEFIIGGKKIDFVSSRSICNYYDEITYICSEPENNINEVFNLQSSRIVK